MEKSIFTAKYLLWSMNLLEQLFPAVKCILKPGEAMYTQSGGMMMYTGDINYSTGLRGGVD